MSLGSGIRKKPISDPGVKKAPIPDPQHYFYYAKPVPPCRKVTKNMVAFWPVGDLPLNLLLTDIYFLLPYYIYMFRTITGRLCRPGARETLPFHMPERSFLIQG
jgi:hypothetical protein